jgi:catechol 2,3-dioxygenase-like lactoylglutathione lyase family enzyme
MEESIGRRGLASLLAFCALLACGLEASAQQPAMPIAEAPLLRAHFHHVRLNTTDPAAAIAFYTTKFRARKEHYAGREDAVWTGQSWLLLHKVSRAPPSETVSGIWHIGWGATDMHATYQRQLDSGTRFATPLTDISDMAGGAPESGRFLYAYVDGPDHVLIEQNTSANNNFGHVHMLSADPPTAGEWYARHFGFRVRAQSQERVYHGVHIAPAAFVTADHVSMIFYPERYMKDASPDLWKSRVELAPTAGRVVDGLGFSVDNLDDAIKLLRADGVRVTAPPRTLKAGVLRSAMIEGPDRVAIELVEDHSPPPSPLAD